MNSPLPPPGLEPTLYFFSNSLTVIAIAGLVFFVLGLWFGYLTWGRFKRRSRAFQEETNLLRLEIAKLKRRIAEDVVTPSPIVAPAPLVGLTPEPEMIMLDQASSAAEPEASAAPVPVLEAPNAPEAETLKETLAAIVGVSPIVPAIPDQAPSPVPESPATEPVAESAPVLAAPAEAATQELVVSVVEETKPEPVAENPVAVSVVLPQTMPEPVPSPAPVVAVVSPASQPEPPAPEPPLSAEPSHVPEPTKADDSAPAPPSELAARLFAEELKSGTVRCDARLGIVYGERPDRWDDLTLMRGVAELTQQRLHDFGIYTFKQIAAWDERVTREVGLAIHAKDRIGRERWSQQARDLHYLKYGEKLA